MALAVPTSAWQPPAAPLMPEFSATTTPMAEATSRASSICRSVRPYCSCRAMSTPGSTPEAPAVGAATIRPIEALTSSTPMA